MKIERQTIEKLHCFYEPVMGVAEMSLYIETKLNAPEIDQRKIHMDQFAKDWIFSYKLLKNYCDRNNIDVLECPNEYAYEFRGDNANLIMEKCINYWNGHNPLYP